MAKYTIDIPDRFLREDKFTLDVFMMSNGKIGINAASLKILPERIANIIPEDNTISPKTYDAILADDLMNLKMPEFFLKQAMMNNGNPVKEFSVFGWKYELKK